MLQYPLEREDIIQIAFKSLPGGGKCRKKKFVSDLALLIHVKKQNC
jgi:hypothetical protein